MPAPLEEHKFKQLVNSKNYNIRALTKHYEIVDSENNQLMTFAISHKKGGKREIKQIYVKKFLELTKEVTDND